MGLQNHFMQIKQYKFKLCDANTVLMHITTFLIIP